MIVVPPIPAPAARLASLCALFALSLWLASCSSTNKIEGVPDRLPDIALAGSTATPGHHMATYEYPFDSAGNYVGDWAAEGERRAGRSAIATNDDEKKWGGSHGGRSTGDSRSRKSSTSKSKGSGTKSKSGSADTGDTPKRKSSTSSSSKSKSGSTKYVVKKGDTLERVASRFGVSVSRLKSANGLKSGQIRAGQTLTIPK